MKRLRDSMLRVVIGLLACSIVAGPALSAGGTGSSSSSTNPSASGGDDVETVPVLRGETGSGFVLEGSWRDVQSVLRDARGPGAPRIVLTRDGRAVQVIYEGRYELRLAKETMDSGRVRVAQLGRGSAVRRRDGEWVLRGG